MRSRSTAWAIARRTRGSRRVAVPQVEAEVLVGDARARRDGEVRRLAQERHGVGRDVVPEQVDAAAPGLEQARRLVGDDAEDDAVEARPPLPGAVEGQHDQPLAGPPLPPAEGAAADGGVGELLRVAQVRRDDPEREVLEERGERLLEHETHGRGVGGLDGRDDRERPQVGRVVLRVAHPVVGVAHVGRGELAPVVEAHAAAQVKDVGGRRRRLPGEGELGRRLAGGVEAQQRVEEQRQDAHRRGAGGQPRVEVRGVGLEPDHERPGVGGRRLPEQAAASSSAAPPRAAISRMPSPAHGGGILPEARRSAGPRVQSRSPRRPAARAGASWRRAPSSRRAAAAAPPASASSGGAARAGARRARSARPGARARRAGCPPACGGAAPRSRAPRRWSAGCPRGRRGALFTPSGSRREPRRLKRSRTAVETLLTFWPPGPEERKKSKEISPARHGSKARTGDSKSQNACHQQQKNSRHTHGAGFYQRHANALTIGEHTGRRGGAKGRSPAAGERSEADGGPQRQDPAARTGPASVVYRC